MHYDQRRKGWLNTQELKTMIQELLPYVTEGDCKYFQVMIDQNGDDQITYEEFLQAAKDVSEIRGGREERCKLSTRVGAAGV